MKFVSNGLAVGLVFCGLSLTAAVNQSHAASPATGPLSAIARDWTLQDVLFSPSGELKTDVVQTVIGENGVTHPDLQERLATLQRDQTPPADPQWLRLYLDACAKRRAIRLQPLLSKWTKLVFVKHHDLATSGANHFSYTENLSDHRGPYFYFTPGSSLCALDLDGPEGTVVPLLEDAQGVVRDPEVAFDGNHLLFSWKKSAREDDYHLYEMDLQSRAVRQLTSGLGFADYGGIYLPDNNILFSSSRCVQNVSCDYNEVSNFFLCDQDGRFMRRIGFDQVHTLYPSLMDDGSVLYMRWEYNDRSQVWPQGLFRMNPDGTHQAEFYGNTSWFPTSILHSRVIPGTSQCVAVLAGHHTHQMGKLAVIDRARGTQEAEGVQLIAPMRKAVSVREDRYGQEGELFRYPYPVTPTSFLVSMFVPQPDIASEWHREHVPRPQEFKGPYPGPFAIYLVDIEGRRELLASDPKMGCYQAVPWAPRERPPVIPATVDYRQREGVFYIQDVYSGMGLQHIPRGTIKSLRVVALKYKPTCIGRTDFTGEGGGSWSTTPVAIGSGSYEAKVVLGSVKIDENGSACFFAPSRTPLYFQAIDAKGYVVQTMRSWTTLQPGETRSCVGCHENKHDAPSLDGRRSIASMAKPKRLEAFRESPRGFSYPAEIQPILDKHCIGCHSPASETATAQNKAAQFDLTGTPVPAGAAKRIWSRSYVTLTQANNDLGKPNPLVNWLDVQCVPTELPPYSAGAAKSRLMSLLEEGHEGVVLSPAEMQTIACWIDLLVPFCGEYDEANAWSDAEKEQYRYYLEKRAVAERAEQRNMEEFSETEAISTSRPKNVSLAP